MSAAANRPVMLAGPITRDVALRVLQKLEASVVREVARQAVAGSIPPSGPRYQVWEDSTEETLRTLTALRALVQQQSATAEMLPAEWEGQ